MNKIVSVQSISVNDDIDNFTEKIIQAIGIIQGKGLEAEYKISTSTYSSIGLANHIVYTAIVTGNINKI